MIDLEVFFIFDDFGVVSDGSVLVNDIWGWIDFKIGCEYVLFGFLNVIVFIDVIELGEF